MIVTQLLSQNISKRDKNDTFFKERNAPYLEASGRHVEMSFENVILESSERKTYKILIQGNHSMLFFKIG